MIRPRSYPELGLGPTVGIKAAECCTVSSRESSAVDRMVAMVNILEFAKRCCMSTLTFLHGADSMLVPWLSICPPFCPMNHMNAKLILMFINWTNTVVISRILHMPSSRHVDAKQLPSLVHFPHTREHHCIQSIVATPTCRLHELLPPV